MVGIQVPNILTEVTKKNHNNVRKTWEWSSIVEHLIHIRSMTDENKARIESNVDIKVDINTQALQIHKVEISTYLSYKTIS